MTHEPTAVASFLSGTTFAVVGASNDRSKFGNKVLRWYWAHQRTAYPINPRQREVEGQPCFATVGDLPTPIDGLSVVAPPRFAEAIVREAHRAGISRIWFQPGAETAAAVGLAERHGMVVISGGPCVLVELGHS